MPMKLIPRDSWPIRTRGSWRHVYVVQEGDDGPVKIGIAANAFWRLNELQVGNFRRLRLIAVFSCDDKRAAYEIEQWAHFQMEERHLGGEWFNMSAGDAVAILKSKAG